MPYKDRNQKRENNRKWYKLNREKRLLSIKAWNDNNKDKLREMGKQWYLGNKDQVAAASKKNYHIRKDEGRLKKYELSMEQKKKKLEYSKEWISNNKERALKRERDRYANDINAKLSRRIRSRLRDAVKGNFKTGSAVSNLGCTVNEFKLYIESLWTEGMSWDNYTKDGWHIDHKILLCSFYLEEPEQFKIACHYTNLQPLWYWDNAKKQTKDLREKRYYSFKDLAA